MNLERLAYLILAITGVAWFILLVTEIDLATSEGVLAVATLVGLGLLLVKALRDRMTNAEDDHYDRTVER